MVRNPSFWNSIQIGVSQKKHNWIRLGASKPWFPKHHFGSQTKSSFTNLVLSPKLSQTQFWTCFQMRPDGLHATCQILPQVRGINFFPGVTWSLGIRLIENDSWLAQLSCGLRCRILPQHSINFSSKYYRALPDFSNLLVSKLAKVQLATKYSKGFL